MTLADIAAAFKIAPTTVSVCIGGKESVYGVRKELAEKVRAYAREHGYAPNRAAARLRGSGGAAPIGIVFNYETGIAKAIEPLRKIVKFLDSIGREYLLMGLQNSHIGETMTTLRSMGVRDVVQLGLCIEYMTGPAGDKPTQAYNEDWRIAENLLKSGMHLYAADYRFPMPENPIKFNMTRVGFNIEKMANQVLLKLIDSGLAPVFFVPWFQLTGQIDSHILQSEKVICCKPGLPAFGLFEFGDALAEKISSLRQKKPIRSVFVGNDYIAAGVVKGLLKRKIKVPEEIGVIGFGNYDTSAYFSRALTTIGSSCGEKALELVQSICGKIPPFPENTELEYKIFERESLVFEHKK